MAADLAADRVEQVETFEIFTVPWPRGGRLGLSRLPQAHSLPMIRAWGAALVVSATPTDEMATLGVEALPLALAEHAIGWRHMPIADFGAPSPSVEANWSQLSAELRGMLDAGHAILVHCRGGCGRSGMIAMRLLVDAGEAPDMALARVRAARPCAVETAEQRAWASGLRRRG